jgi:hypothetical protein
MKYLALFLVVTASAAFFLSGCEEIKSYPDEPYIEYKTFGLYRTTDALGNPILQGQLQFGFTDGNGDIGLNQPDSATIADTLKYNMFLRLYELKNGILTRVEGVAGEYNYRIPFIERTGQNKTLKGDIYVDLEYKTIVYDSILYTFYIMDRAFNRSNTDTTGLIVFTGITL